MSPSKTLVSIIALCILSFSGFSQQKFYERQKSEHIEPADSTSMRAQSSGKMLWQQPVKRPTPGVVQNSKFVKPTLESKKTTQNELTIPLGSHVYNSSKPLHSEIGNKYPTKSVPALDRRNVKDERSPFREFQLAPTSQSLKPITTREAPVAYKESQKIATDVYSTSKQLEQQAKEIDDIYSFKENALILKEAIQKTKSSALPQQKKVTSSNTRLVNSMSTAAAVAADESDSLILVNLYNSTNGDFWNDNSGWLTGTLDTWFGVTVDGGGKVTLLYLNSNNLEGSIPTELGGLTSLTELVLYSNSLSGEIPTSLGNLANLTYLDLDQNQLTGGIPAELGNLTNLNFLYLGFNQLSGSIPSSLGNLTSLLVLGLYSNQLSGGIPPELGDLLNLVHLHLNSNQLEGDIPSSIGQLVNLVYLDFRSNTLGGSLPTEIGNLTSLTELHLYNNQLTGSIPPEIGNLTSLYALSVGNNQLSGNIPVEIGNLVNLTTLYLWGNQLTGSIPSELGNLVNLINLELSSNQLTGNIPSQLGNLTNLSVLYLQNNLLTGTIPPEIGNLTSLSNLSFGGNALSGELPSEIGNLTALTELMLWSNQLSGALPSSLGNLVNLTDADFSPNEFSGNIPPELGNLTQLQTLWLNNNSFEGNIPAEFGQLSALEYLYLQGNLLMSGELPLELTNLISLSHFDLSSTPLCEPEDPSYGAWSAGLIVYNRPSGCFNPVNESDSLALVDFYNATIENGWSIHANWLSGPVSTWYGVIVSNGRVTELNLAYNEIECYQDLPTSFYSLNGLEVIDFRGNYINSIISSSIGNLTNLKELDLYSSGFYGIIPEEIYSLPLQTLDLSYNGFDGEISTNIGNLTNLEHIGLSGNNFSGTLPATFWSLERIKTLSLDSSPFIYVGGIPNELINFDSLEYIDLGSNNLTTIPDFIFEKSSITNLDLHYNDFSQFTTQIFDKSALLPNLERLYLQGSNLTGAIPESINQMGSLLYLEVQDNYLNDLPVLQNDQTFYYLFYNSFTFEDFEKQNIAPVSNFNISPQRPIGKEYVDTLIFSGQTYTIDATVGGEYNHYQWYWNGSPIEEDTSPTINIGSSYLDGEYFCQISSDSITSHYGLTLHSGYHYVDIVNPVDPADSLALVQFYNENNGSNWQNQSGWLIQPVELWSGISTENGRVVGISMYDNYMNAPLSNAISNLDLLQSLDLSYAGITSLPTDIGNLIQLQSLSLYGNTVTTLPASVVNLQNLFTLQLDNNQISTFPAQITSLESIQSLSITGNQITSLPTEITNLINLYELNLGENQFTTVPAELGSMTSLQYLYLYDNQIAALPDLSLFSSNTYIDLTNNRLDFEDIEPYAGLTNLNYYNQRRVSSGSLIDQSSGTPITITLDPIGGSANEYQWYLNNQPIAGQNTRDLASYTPTGDGFLECLITSELVTEMVLQSGKYVIYIPKDTTINPPALYYLYENEIFENDVYYYEEGLAVSDLSGTNFNMLSKTVTPYFTSVDPINQKIYFAGELYEDEDAIWSMDFDGGALQQIWQTNFDELEDVAVDYINGHIYYTDGCCSGGVSFIKRVNIDGTNDQVIVSGLDDPIELEIDLTNGKLYWSEFSDNHPTQILRSNLDGSTIENIFEESVDDGYDGGLKIDPANNSIFFATNDGINSVLNRYDLDGSFINQILSSGLFDEEFAIVPGTSEVYFVYEDINNFQQNLLHKVNYDGSNETYLSTLPVQNIYGLFALDGTPPIPMEKTYFWIGDGGSWFDLDHWSTTSGGAPDVTQLPDNLTNVRFDQNSFTNTGQVVLVPDIDSQTRPVFKDMTWTGVTNNPTLRIRRDTSPWIENSCFGSLILDENMTVDNLGGEFYFASEEDFQIDTKGHFMGDGSFMAIGLGVLAEVTNKVTCTLLSDLHCSHFYIRRGNFVSNGHKLTAMPNDRSEGAYLFLAGDSITFDVSGSVVEASNFIYTTSRKGITLIDQNATLKVTSTLRTKEHNFENMILFDTARVSQSATFGTLTIEPGSTVLLDSAITIQNELLLNGTAQDSIRMLSGLGEGQSITINKASGVVDGFYLSLKDNNATGGAQFNAYNSKNGGNVTGWTFIESIGPSITTSDSLALVAIYDALGGLTWTNKSGWLTGPAYTWFGIDIDQNLRVTSIELPNNNLNGKLNQNLFVGLTMLAEVNLEKNQLSGGIPLELLSIPLKVLKLGNNKLSGEIADPSPGYISTLLILDISQNQFYGKLPPSGSFPVTEVFKVDHNLFEGSLSSPLSTMTNLRVLLVNDNMLTGSLPASISGLSLLDTLDVSNNGFSGTLPTDIGELANLKWVNLSFNELTGSASAFSGTNSLSVLKIDHNRFTDIAGLEAISAVTDATSNFLDFGDFQLLGQAIPQNFTLNPQDSLYNKIDSLHTVGVPLTISHNIGGSGNSYQWLKNGNAISEATSNMLSFASPDTPDEGSYVLRITNSAYPDFTLFTSPFAVKIGSLERDKAALLNLLANVTGFTPTNWSAATLPNNTWQGVTVTNNRVTSLVLKGTEANQWTGIVPNSFADMTGLQVIDLSDHQLRSFPNISKFPSLQSVNISNNRLSFAHIVPNISIANLTYAPQKRFGETLYDTLEAGGNIRIEVANMGAGSQYEWRFGPLIPGQPFNNDVTQTRGNSRLLQIENINYDNQGTYRVYVTHPQAPLLTIESRNQNIMAKTDLFGTITKDNTPLTTGGEVFIYRQTPSGPFAKEDSTLVQSNGKYSLQGVVLGNFVVVVKPVRSVDASALQTYYESSRSYLEADTLKLRGRTEGVDIEVLRYTEAAPGTAQIGGFIESDFADEIIDEEGQRITSRRKVKKAACSMRRFKIKGRDEQDDVETEIAYYIETDDEGYFNFEDVAPGRYLINIEFPGVPMNSNSEVEFEISEDKENQVFEVNALITELGISIEQTEILFNWKPFVKDIVVYPNPTKGLLNLDYLVYRNIQDLKIRVITIQGNLVFEQEVAHEYGIHKTELDLSEYNSGVYFLIFTNEANTFRYELKVTKQ